MNEPSSNHRPGYARPQDAFACGHEQGCRRGPTSSGGCCAENECAPVQIDGRWVCKRSIARGGPCTHGPGAHGECGMPGRPCQPRASLRIKRKRIALLSLGVTLAIVSVLLGSSYNGALLAPGPLCSAHANVLKEHTGLDRCARCHTLADQGPGTWIAALFSREGVGAVNSEKCLACHDATLPRLAARNPHNLPSSQLEALTTAHQSRQNGMGETVVSRMATTLVAGDMSQVECATCHREHQSDLELAHLTDQQCQVCHVQTFHSFEVDHPEFVTFPTQFERHVAFDHRSHESKHFREKGIAYSCDMCHVEEPTRQAMRLRPFDEACAQCHQSTIDVASMDGLELLRLPGIDASVLRASGLEPGDWPVELSTGFDGQLSPLTLALLHGDAKARRAIATLGGSVDFTMLDDSNADELAAAHDIVWALKRLIWDLASGDQAAIEERLELSGAGDGVARRQWVAMLPGSQLEELAAVWLPDLEFELKQIESLPEAASSASGEANVPGSSQESSEPATSTVPSINSQVPAEPIAANLFPGTMSLSEQQLLAENPLRAMRVNGSAPAVADAPADTSSEAGVVVAPPQTDVAIAPNSASSDAAALEPAVPSELGLETPDVPATPASPSDTENLANVAPERQLLAPAANPAGELLAANPLRELLGVAAGGAASGSPVQEAPAGEGSQTESPLAGNPLGPLETPTLTEQEAPSESMETTETPVELNETEQMAEAQAESSLNREDGQVLPWRFTPERKVGWVRSDRSWTLVYYPQAHADGVLARSIEIVAGASWELDSPQDLAVSGDGLLNQLVAWRQAAEESSHAAGIRAFAESMSSPTAVGACTKCHQMPGADAARPMQWRGYRRDVNRSQFTRFSHAPHVTQTELRDCRSCHSLETDGVMQTVSTGGGTGMSEFHAMTRQDCANCHRSGRASNSCTTCHSYHVDLPTLGH